MEPEKCITTCNVAPPAYCDEQSNGIQLNYVFNTAKIQYLTAMNALIVDQSGFSTRAQSK